MFVSRCCLEPTLSSTDRRAWASPCKCLSVERTIRTPTCEYECDAETQE